MRIIPITIITAVLFAVLKFVDISNSSQEVSKGFIISSVEAEQAEGEKKELMTGEDKAAATEGKKPEEAQKAEGAKEEKPKTEEVKKEGAKEGEPSEEGAAKEEANPAVSTELETTTNRHFSESELDLLNKLASRRRELARWERNIQIKEEVLNATEKRINEQIAQIESMRKQVAKLLGEYNEKEDTKIRSLVKIYENMKPKDAARIFDEVEMPVLLLVLDKMSEKKAAPILAGMNPKKAKQITVELAEQRRFNANALDSMAPSAAPGK